MHTLAFQTYVVLHFDTSEQMFNWEEAILNICSQHLRSWMKTTQSLEEIKSICNYVTSQSAYLGELKKINKTRSFNREPSKSFLSPHLPSSALEKNWYFRTHEVH